VLDYLLSIKEAVITLPTSHSKDGLNFPRFVLLILPLLQWLEEDEGQRDKLKQVTRDFCLMIESSEYAIAVKINA
jgi:hypothetical protein